MRGRIFRWLTGAVVVIASLFAQTTSRALAIDTSANGFLSNQNYNQLISDGDFTDVNSMSLTDIQNFLASQGSDLATLDPSLLGNGANGRKAAQIISDAAHAADSASSGTAQNTCITNNSANCSAGTTVIIGTVSPKVLLVTLQKEEGLVTGWKYDSSQNTNLNSAMGYGCPDSSQYGCPDSRHPEWAGFSNQVGWAAWQLRWNFEMSKANNSIVSPFIVNNQLPNMTYNLADLGLSGSVTVNLSNNATASLYRYTPHLFNGNYNFWKLGISWFGFGTVATSTAGGSNDTASFKTGTYGTSFKASGTKSTAVKAVYNNQTIADFNTTTWAVAISPDLGTHDYAISYLNTDGSTAGTKTITIERHKVGDINGDGKVDILDLSLLVNSWGQTVRGDNWVNLNPDVDNKIDILDLSILAHNWTG
jgi:hypothetical protein